MQSHWQKKYRLKNFIIAALLSISVSPIPVFSEPPKKSREECNQIEKKIFEIDKRLFEEVSGVGGSRQPGMGPKAAALKKERDKLEEKRDLMCRQ